MGLLPRRRGAAPNRAGPAGGSNAPNPLAIWNRDDPMRAEMRRQAEVDSVDIDDWTDTIVRDGTKA